MRPHIIVISLVLMLLTVGIILFLVATYAPPAGAVGPEDGAGSITPMPADAGENPYADFAVPEFELTDRDGNPITHAALDGHYTVLDFFFTSCPLWCPGMSQAMARVQNETKGTKARLMSISIDGDLDTPQIIDQYATRYGADPTRWAFATGDPGLVASIVKDGLKFEIGDVGVDPDSGGRAINHPTRLILLGPDRHVIGLYRYDDTDEVDALIAKVKQLAG
jgi:cytochrome oxidase Cu insertion factor (SCO1/SenC/PrrC family)